MCCLSLYRRVLLAVFLTVSLLPQATAKIIRVAPDADPDNVQDGSTWQNTTNHYNAVAIAEEGDEIWLQSGVYHARQDPLQTTQVISFFGGFTGNESVKSERQDEAPMSVFDGNVRIPETEESFQSEFNLIWISTGLEPGEGGSVMIDKMKFIRSSSQSAVLVRGVAEVKVTNCQFEDSRGSIFVNSAGLFIEDCTFHSIRSDFDACIYFESNDVTINRIEASGNVVGSIISGLSSIEGDAILNLSDCSFTRNEMPRGGSVISVFGRDAILTRCNFDQNYSNGAGAALSVSLGTVRATNSRFVENRSSEAGGAIRLNHATEDQTSQFINCSFAGNQSFESGSLIHVSSSSDLANLLFHNCTMLDNFSDGDALVDGSVENIDMINCIVADLLSGPDSSPPLVYRRRLPSSPVQFSHCIYPGSGGTAAWDEVLGTDLGGNLDLLPAIIPTTFDLQASSPAINAGTEIFDLPDLADLDSDGDTTEAIPLDISGKPRLQGGRIDIGVIEFAGGPKATAPISVSNAPGQDVFPLRIDLRDFFDSSAVSFEVVTNNPAPVVRAQITDPTGVVQIDVVEGVESQVSFEAIATDGEGNRSTLVFPVSLVAENPRLYVKKDATGSGTGTSWDDAIPALQSALALAAPNTEIWVASGVYYPDEGFDTTAGDPSETFYTLDGLLLFGGFTGTEATLEERDLDAAPTVLSGDIDDNDNNTDQNFIAEDTTAIQGVNTKSIITIVGDQDVTIDNFTLTAGSADLGNSTGPVTGAGAGLVSGSTVAWSNCTFIGNQRVLDSEEFNIYARGGALRLLSSTAAFSKCDFQSNSVSVLGLPSGTQDLPIGAGGAVSSLDNKVNDGGLPLRGKLVNFHRR